MRVLTNLLNSEKAVVALAILAAATVLFAMGRIDVDAWTSVVEWIGGAYIVGKSIQGAGAALAAGKKNGGTP